jgi:multidrug efflux system outer membrane protein
MRAPAVLAAAGVLLAGCSLGPRYERAAAPVPQGWPADTGIQRDEEALPRADYRTLFQDERLVRLVALALENNRDLRRAAANVARARAQYGIQRAALFPQVDAGIDLVQRASGSAPATSSAAADVSVNAYEIDLFGRLRSRRDAASDHYAARADAQALRLALIGDLAEAWLQHAADRSLLDLARATVASAQRSVDLTQARLTGGIAPRTDLRQAQTILATARADVARYTAALAQVRNLVELLAGAPVEPALLPDAIENAAARIGEPAIAMSSAVLLRRPDVMAAEHELRAAHAEVAAARAALFPRVTLGALIGLVGPSLDGLFGDPGTRVRQGAVAVNYPIFRAGAGRAGVAASQAQREALLAAYERAIQSAYRETADVLARRATIADQLAADRLRVEAAEDAQRLSEARYRGGIDSFLQALDAQRSAYAARRTLIATQLEAARTRVRLYRTLGGEAADETDLR